MNGPLAKRFHFCVEIISAADDTMTPFTFSPKQKNSRFVSRLQCGFIKTGVIFSVSHLGIVQSFLKFKSSKQFLHFFSLITQNLRKYYIRLKVFLI